MGQKSDKGPSLLLLQCLYDPLIHVPSNPPPPRPLFLIEKSGSDLSDLKQTIRWPFIGYIRRPTIVIGFLYGVKRSIGTYFYLSDKNNVRL